MKKAEELTVIAKTYDLILLSCNHTNRFPRNHRSVLAEWIERNLYDLLETLIRAKYTKNRQQLMEEAKLKVERYTLVAKSISSRRRISESASRSSSLVHLNDSAFLRLPSLRTTWALSGALVCVKLCLTTSPPLGHLPGVDEFDPATLALDRVGVFENRTPAHSGSSTFWDSYCVSDFRSQVQSLITTRSV